MAYDMDQAMAIAAKSLEVGISFSVEEDLIPDDVVIQVLTQARTHLIDRTFESIL